MQQGAETKSSSQSLIKLKRKNLVLKSSNIFSQYFFTWLNSLIFYAMRHVMEQEAIPELPQKFKSINQSHSLITIFDQEVKSGVKRKPGVKLLKAILKSLKSYALPTFVSYLLTVLGEILAPILTQKVIKYIENDQKTVLMSFVFVGLIVFSRLLFTICLSYLCFKMAVLNFNTCNTLCICVFNKALKFPTLCNKNVSTAELVNYTQVDAQRFTDIGWDLGSVLFAPAVLVFGIIYMYINLGLSFIAGMGVMILVLLIVYFITKRLNRVNDNLLKSKDSRMKITTEIFGNIRFIKSNAWEKYYFNKLNRSRNEELDVLKNVNYLSTLKILLMWLAIPLSISATFGAYVLLGNTLTASVAFSTIVLFGILEYPMSRLPKAIGTLSQTWSSIKRLEKFLMMEEMQNGYIKNQDDGYADYAIMIKNGDFYWEIEKLKKSDQINLNVKEKIIIPNQTKQEDLQEQDPMQIKKSLLSDYSVSHQENTLTVPHIKALVNLNLKIKKNKLTMILGAVGSGKSSLLLSILGQMKAFPGSNAEIAINGSVTYVPQKSWVMSRNIEQNIIMTLEKDKCRLNSALQFSCLDSDIKQFPDGVNTMIGEKGINLSGGQKARVCLARALYSDKDIYLLDDIISAVDVHVGDRIIKQCILKYLKNKTVVLVTHALLFAKYADEIIIMKKGEVADIGTYQQLKNTIFFQQILQQSQKQSKKENQNQQRLPDPVSLHSAQQKSIQFQKHQVQQSDTNKAISQLLLPEDRSRGQVKRETYLKYFQLNGGWVFLTVIFISMSLYVALSILGNIQIKKWCETEQGGLENLYIYMAYSLAAGFATSFRAAWIYRSGIKQSSTVHKKMIKGLMYASIPEFYDRVPTGRILNRVSKDLREVDENIAFYFGNFLICLFQLIGNIIICIYAATPYVLIPAGLLFAVCFIFKNYYMRCQREVVRIESVSSSPILSSFTEVVNGLANVRAYKLENSFYERQCNLVDVNKRNKMCKQAVSAWFEQRLGMMALLITITASAYCLFSNQTSPALAGLLMAYSSSIDYSIVWLTANLALFESKMVSIERVSTFMAMKPQKGYQQYTKKWRTKDEPTEKVVHKGKVQFKNLYLRYRQNLPFVLKDINLEIKPGEKIGVVGRTGAGKSTIIQSLLRLIQPSQGAILIDGQNITEVPLKNLRSSLTLISQQPVLLAGTLRQNLDPRNQHSDQQLISALEKCCLLDLFNKKQLLDTIISESGENLSVGEKQLICITRAILRSNKLVLIDQATANIDMKSDQLIQETIRTCFKHSTVITIAHRIKTILDSDRILVLEKGRIAQFDTPNRLKERRGIFNEMYQKSIQEGNQ